MVIKHTKTISAGKQPGSGDGHPHRHGPDRVQLRLQQQDPGLHEAGQLEGEHGADIELHPAAAGKHPHHSRPEPSQGGRQRFKGLISIIKKIE